MYTIVATSSDQQLLARYTQIFIHSYISYIQLCINIYLYAREYQKQKAQQSSPEDKRAILRVTEPTKCSMALEE